MPQTLNTIILKLKPVLFVVFGIYAFVASYPSSFTTSLSHAEQQVNCKTGFEQKVISWTGGCVNGLLDGDGELVFEMTYEGKTASVKRVSRYNRGVMTGVYFTKSLTPANGVYWSMLQVSNDSVAIATGDSKTSDYDMLTYTWWDKHYNPEVEMTFDEAFAKTVAQAKKANLNSIDPYTLKEYLSGRYKFTKAVSQTSSNSSGLENHSDGTDDAQVFGGSSSPKASKRKK